MLNCKKIISLTLCSAIILLCAGCSFSSNTGETEQTTVNAEQTAASTQQSNNTEQSTDTTKTEATTLAETNDMFTSRDIETGYDVTNSTVISLNETGIGCSDSSVKVSETTATITTEGTYILHGTILDGQIIVDAADTDKIQLILDGVSITKNTSAPIYVKQADKVFITLTQNSENTLSSKGTFVNIDENNIDACIFSKDDITINGSGVLNISSESGHGIVSKDSLVITGGTLTVNAAKHALAANDDIRVLTGTFNLICEKDALNCDNDEDNSESYIYIAGGEFDISCGDDGMHAAASLTIDGGKINITKSYEGLEGLEVIINGGTINVVSSDDGLNSAGGNDQSGFGNFNDMFSSDSAASITINGGEICISSDGDGIDSNGNLYVNGGKIYVYGPENSGNSALDYNGTATLKDGYIVATGYSGMFQNFTASEKQCSAVVAVTGTAGETLTLTDSNGNTLLSCTPNKSYNCVLVSCPSLLANASYTLTSGNSDVTFTPDSNTYSEVGSAMGGFGGGGRGQNGIHSMPSQNNEPSQNSNVGTINMSSDV